MNDSPYCSKSETEDFFFKQNLRMFLFNKHACVVQIVLVAMTETMVVMSLHLAGHIPGPAPECPASGLAGIWETSPGHYCTLWHSQDYTRAWWEGGWGLPDAKPNCLWHSRPLLLPNFLEAVLGTVHSKYSLGLCWISGAASKLPVLFWLNQKFRCGVARWCVLVWESGWGAVENTWAMNLRSQGSSFCLFLVSGSLLHATDSLYILCAFKGVSPTRSIKATGEELWKSWLEKERGWGWVSPFTSLFS